MTLREINEQAKKINETMGLVTIINKGQFIVTKEY